MRKEKFVAVVLAAAIALASGSAMATSHAGDAAKGKKVFKKCKACHTVNKGGKKRAGPNLFGIVGKKAGSVDGFRYSGAMKDSGLTWDEATLDKFLKKPRKLIKKTRMSFSGVKKDSQRTDLVAYLKTLK